MRDIGERPAVDESGVVFQSLHKVRLHRVFQQHGHRTIRFDIARIDRFTLAGIGDDHVTKALLQVV